MELGSLQQRQYFKYVTIPKKHPREILYLRWVNDQARSLQKDLDKADYKAIGYNSVFNSPKVTRFTSACKNFYYMKKRHNFTNFNDIKIKASYIYYLDILKKNLCYLIVEEIDETLDTTNYQIFQDLFEKFIFFTRRVNLKKFEDYEMDLFVNIESDIESDIESENEDENNMHYNFDNLLVSDSENESD